jgi:hypothetical protein
MSIQIRDLTRLVLLAPAHPARYGRAMPQRLSRPRGRAGKPDRLRALELLASCAQEGCTRGGDAGARLHGRDDGRACARRARDGEVERVVAGARKFEVALMMITETGQKTVRSGEAP